MKKRQVEVDT